MKPIDDINYCFFQMKQNKVASYSLNESAFAWPSVTRIQPRISYPHVSHKNIKIAHLSGPTDHITV